MAAMKKGRRRTKLKNPKGGRWMIGDEVEAIYYRKGQPHSDCDAKCKAADHRFVHRFKRKFPLIGRPDGLLEI